MMLQIIILDKLYQILCWGFKLTIVYNSGEYKQDWTLNLTAEMVKLKKDAL